ncbi:lysozyme C-like [Anabas testudineus]|uniref:lysozyme C-like n=1 Tax=Anabas testudineus TaxID=64144 RepID=UPI000E460FB4|nr:lysozyme C-like [Anabas testudineus]
MKIYAAFLLAVLGCSLAEGQLLSKCQLRNELQVAVGNLTAIGASLGLSVDDLLAKLVCNAELGSGLNIGTIKNLILKEVDGIKNCKLLGIFQLSSCLVCNDGLNLSENLCGIPCINLLDDNLLDDISCLVKTLPSVGGQAVLGLGGLLGSVLNDVCGAVQASLYFAGCA